MSRILQTFERIIVIALLAFMMIAVLLSTIELAVIIIKELMAPPFMLLDVREMLEIFGFFLMVLIGLELIESIRAFMRNDEIHAEIVILVAMVAVSRKVIILNYGELDSNVLFGMAALIIALGVAYYLVQRALRLKDNRKPDLHS